MIKKSHFSWLSLKICANSNADLACYKNSGNIGMSGCNGLTACYQNEGNVGKDSCSTTEKFENETDDFPEGWRGACAVNRATIGELSCKEQGSCLGNMQDIGNSSCLGYHACVGNEGLIDDESWYVLFTLAFLLYQYICGSFA